jgi:ABC-2 type transport system permease protein
MDSGIPQWLKDLYLINPLVGIIELHHAVWSHHPPSGLAVSAAIVGSLLMLFGGYWIFRKLEPSVLKEL